MILETITDINTNLLAALGEGQRSGLVVPFYDQQERATGLLLPDTKRRLTLDSKQSYQTGHLVNTLVPTSGGHQYGSFREHIYEARLVLMGASLSYNTAYKAMRALSNTPDVVIGNVELNTLEVLRRYWLVKADQDKNYNPALFAFAISYSINDVSDDAIQGFIDSL